MTHAYDAILGIHVAAALASLPTFWIALLLRKGSRPHRQVGRLFVRAAVAMAATGGLLAAALAIDPLGFRPPPESEDPAVYAEVVRRIGSVLVFVSLLTLWLVALGTRALRRRAAPLHQRLPDLAFAAFYVASGGAAIPFADRPGWEALDGVGLTLIGLGAISLWRSGRLSTTARLVDHLAGILGAGTVLHGALAVQLVPRLVGGFEGERMFDAAKPVVAVGLLLTTWACLHYRRKLSRGRERAARGALEQLAELATDPL